MEPAWYTLRRAAPRSGLHPGLVNEVMADNASGRPRALQALLGPRLLSTLILAPSLALMLAGLGRPIHGQHSFRQAHVAANVEKYLAQGLSLHPSTYNQDIPLTVFDFPLYQLMVATASRALGADPLGTSRAVSIISFALTFILLASVLAGSGIEPGHAGLALLFFAMAPLNLFYFQSPMVDDLAILLSVLSLYACLRVEASRGGTKLVFAALMTLSGMLATMIKSPVYLPFFIAIVLLPLWRHGWSGLRRPGVWAFGVVILATVIGFRLYSTSVNQTAGALSAEEEKEYFGLPEERLQPRLWGPIVVTVCTEILNPLTSVLFVVGILSYARRFHRTQGLYWGLLFGTMVAIFVFFGRHRWHNYYQLPLVFPFAFFAAHGGWRLLMRLHRLGTSARARCVLAGSFVAVLVGASLYYGVRGHARLSVSEGTERTAADGQWIRHSTQPDDYVVYLLNTRERDWSPAFLYFAKRDGFNLARPELTRSELDRLWATSAGRYRRVLVFCPRILVARTWRKLNALGAVVLKEGEAGRLYWVPRRPPPRA
jgi:hypothetical protein